ncbi:hypothetical protein AB6D13_18585 [Vibrio cyclitrophicus]
MSKTLGLFILTPLIITNYGSEEVVIWYITITMTMIILMFDFGFTPTVIRYLIFSKENINSKRVDCKKIKVEGLILPGIRLLEYTHLIIKKLYFRISILALLSSIVLGGIYFNGFISSREDEFIYWVAWIIFSICISIRLWANKNIAILQSYQHYALTQRLMMISNLIGITFAILSVLVGLELPYVIIVFQVFSSYYVYTIIKKKCELDNIPKTILNNLQSNGDYKILSKSILLTSFKSGTGILLSTGVFQISILAMAKSYEPSVSASYMFMVQVIRSIGSFTQVPFYAKIPKFNESYHKDVESSVLSKNIMLADTKALILMFFGCIVFGLYISSPLDIWKSIVPKQYLDLWLLLSIAFLIERQGAIKVQIYSITNHVVWHYLNGFTGIVFLILLYIVFGLDYIYSFPISIILSYSLIYYPISVFLAGKVIDKRQLSVQVILLFLIVLVLFLWYYYEVFNNISYL